MRTHPPWLLRARRSLAERLERLGDALDALRERLRESVATVLGQTVNAAVHDALRVLLSARLETEPTPRSSWRTQSSAGMWDEPDDPYGDHRPMTLPSRVDDY